MTLVINPVCKTLRANAGMAASRVLPGQGKGASSTHFLRYAMPSDDFEQIVSQHYESLYRFAFSLTRAEADACDLTQQTFYIWATKGHQLQDRSKVKSWLFTTLHREFLNSRKRSVRFPHVELDEGVEDVPVVAPDVVNSLDGAQVVEFLGRVPEPFRAAVTLFYMNGSSYQEIADILQVPLGTVRSRISRGIAQLKQFILADVPGEGV